MLPFLLLPAFVLAAPSPAVPDSVRVHPRIWVLKIAPTAVTYSSLKTAGITHVINVRRDGEPGFDENGENAAVSAAEVAYIRLALSRTPSKDDFELFRAILRDLPGDAKILVHCGNGNRAAAAVCGYLVRETGMAQEKALALAREAGLAAPETEKALRAYLGDPKA